MIHNKLQFYLSRMKARGFDAAQVLRGSDLTPRQIEDSLYQAAPEQYRRIIENMLRLTGEPFLGIALGSEFKISDLGVLGYATLSSPNLRETRDLWNRYAALSEEIIRIRYVLGRDKWYAEIREIFPLGKLLPFAIEEFVTRTVRLVSFITEKPYPLKRLDFSFPLPPDVTVYKERFNSPMHFAQPYNRVHFDINYLNGPISLANQDVFRLCESQCQALLRRIQTDSPASTFVRSKLLENPGKFPAIDSMAKLLGIGSRTLRRRLTHEGTTYQQIIAETRRDLAIEHLLNTSTTPKEVAYFLGYGDVTSFRRAFRSWTGQTISAFRRRAARRSDDQTRSGRSWNTPKIHVGC